MYQAFVKTTRYMRGHHEYAFGTPVERLQFLKDHGPEIWWYFFPESDEFSFSDPDGPSWSSPRTGHAGWLKGGAWDAQSGPEHPAEAPGDEIIPAPEPKGSRW